MSFMLALSLQHCEGIFLPCDHCSPVSPGLSLLTKLSCNSSLLQPAETVGASRALRRESGLPDSVSS